MRGDKRQVRRHRMSHDAWLIFDGGERSECTWMDISGKGARLSVPDSEAVPDDFVLLLAENGSARRRCHVIWRKPRQIGVKFETKLDEKLRAVLGKKPAADASAAAEETEPAESDA